ncbi:hypothetical protein DE146DRAFT_657280 [Phaeosphaeria sp. MPI-PUGE-AT-0046c]|nr:hypothetical protein DE146DRAFT_657280 [Phaeosphaeria sp. MPI-PUGE-AT-0046c]
MKLFNLVIALVAFTSPVFAKLDKDKIMGKCTPDREGSQQCSMCSPTMVPRPHGRYGANQVLPVRTEHSLIHRHKIVVCKNGKWETVQACQMLHHCKFSLERKKVRKLTTPGKSLEVEGQEPRQWCT